MVKRLFLYILVVGVVFFAAFYIHDYCVLAQEIPHPFSLLKVYLFHALASVIIVIIFDGLASFATQLKDQLGFLYLVSMATKLMFFCIIFRDILFSTTVLIKRDSVSLLIPIVIFLVYEVFFIAKILNRNTYV